jgi:hypothetical protein
LTQKNFFAKFEMGLFKSRFYADSEAVEKDTKITHKKIMDKKFYKRQVKVSPLLLLWAKLLGK